LPVDGSGQSLHKGADTHPDNFDIYLPLWLARRNKMIFGTLFGIGELFVFGRWMFSGQQYAVTQYKPKCLPCATIH
jgi:hypothetical protein